MKKSSHPQVYRIYKSQYGKDAKLINDLFFWNKKIPKEKEVILNKIISQCEDIYISLSKIIEIGVYFELCIVGGAIRDFILGRENYIKDLDITIQYRDGYMPSIAELKKSRIDISNNLLNEKLNNPDFEYYLKNLKKNFSLAKAKKNKSAKINISQFLLTAYSLSEFDIIDIYPPYDPFDKNGKDKIVQHKNDTYVEGNINSVIKLNKSNWDWPVDIIILNTNIRAYVNNFDFGICETGIYICKYIDLISQKYKFPKLPKEFLQEGFVTTNFIENNKNKELKLKCNEVLTLKQLQNSLFNHYERLKVKYSDYVFNHNFYLNSYSYDPNYEAEGNYKLKERKKEIIKNFLMSLELRSELNLKKEKKVVNKL